VADPSCRHPFSSHVYSHTSSHRCSLSTLSEPRRSKLLHGSTGVLHTPFLRVNYRFLLILKLRNLGSRECPGIFLTRRSVSQVQKKKRGKKNHAFAIYIVLTLRARCRVHGDLYETRQQENRRGLSTHTEDGAMRYPVTRQQARTYNADHIVTGGHSSLTKPSLAHYSITIKQWPKTFLSHLTPCAKITSPPGRIMWRPAFTPTVEVPRKDIS
jgi:hypothetical protein